MGGPDRPESLLRGYGHTAQPVCPPQTRDLCSSWKQASQVTSLCPFSVTCNFQPSVPGGSRCRGCCDPLELSWHMSRLPITEDVLSLTRRPSQLQRGSGGGSGGRAPVQDLPGGQAPLLSAVCCWTPGVTVCQQSAPQDGRLAQETSSCNSAHWPLRGATCRCPRSECPGCAARSG